MKTTIEVSDALLAAAKKLAAEEGTTLRSLVDAGLRHVLSQKQAAKKAFQLPDARVSGKGLRAELQGRSWSEILELSYGDRG